MFRTTTTKLAGVAVVVCAFVVGCKSGLIGDRAMGGDNNNYDYYGDPCTS